jgi:hypothetical protein
MCRAARVAASAIAAKRTYPTAKTTDRSLCDLSQKCLNLLNRISIGLRSGDKGQSRRIKIALLTNPAPPRSRHVGAMLLGCPQDLPTHS